MKTALGALAAVAVVATLVLPAGMIRPAIDDHLRMLEAIAGEDARGAEAATRRHIDDAAPRAGEAAR